MGFLNDNVIVVTYSSPSSFCLFWMQIRRNMAKLELYRKFTNSLAVSVLLSVAWIGFEVLLIVNSYIL